MLIHSREHYSRVVKREITFFLYVQKSLFYINLQNVDWKMSKNN